VAGGASEGREETSLRSDAVGRFPLSLTPSRLLARVVSESGSGEGRVEMVRVFVRHTVEDYAAWRAVYDDFDNQRRAMGVTGDEVFQSVDDPNEVTVWHDFDSEDSARAFASSDELRGAMSEAGVQDQPQVWFTSKM
jgi:heme-degrading monooxygenase HmoA